MVTSGSSRPTVMREWDGEPTYHAAHPLGKGAFASVYRAVRIEDGKLFAIKELERRVFKKANVLDSRVEDEVTIMKQLSHVRFLSRRITKLTLL
jgi:serine/threonine protein kinase